jgi:hypothetical protein
MLKEIIIDIIPFLIFLLICIGMFANPMVLLDQVRLVMGIPAPINEEVFGEPLVDSFIRSYLVGLGEFGMDNFSENDKYLVWIFFILSTVITQLIFMNLLIAIMGDTFGRVQEVKERSGVRERVEMIQDFIWVLDLQEEFNEYKYVLVVEQLNSNGGPASTIEGKFAKMNEFIKRQMESLEKSVKNKIAELDLKITNISQGDKDLKAKLDEQRYEIMLVEDTVKRESNQVQD